MLSIAGGSTLLLGANVGSEQVGSRVLLWMRGVVEEIEWVARAVRRDVGI